LPKEFEELKSRGVKFETEVLDFPAVTSLCFRIMTGYRLAVAAAATGG
jgi:hypothetical protein